MRHHIVIVCAALAALSFGACRDRQQESGQLAATGLFAANLQETPGPKGAVARELRPGERLEDVDETSDFMSPLQLGDTVLAAPWLRVKTSDGRMGWVFAAAVAPTEGDWGAWFWRKKMDCFFGKTLARQAIGWANAMENAQTDEDFADAFRAGAALRKQMNSSLERHRERSEAGFSPDFFWLNEAAPGYFVQLLEGRERPNLFADYRHFRQIAAQTTGEQDDFFAETCLAAFPMDSLESRFPAWKMQTASDAGCSNLGAGQHLKMLAAIDRGLGAGDFFAPELLAMKDRLLDDFLDNEAAFWQPKNLIVKELSDLLARKFSCLTDRDRIALTERLRILKDAEANGVRTNLRAGK